MTQQDFLRQLISNDRVTKYRTILASSNPTQPRNLQNDSKAKMASTTNPTNQRIVLQTQMRLSSDVYMKGVLVSIKFAKE